MTAQQKYTVMVVVDRVVRRPYTTYVRGIEAESETDAIRKANDALGRLPDPPGAGWEEGEAFDPELAEPAFFLSPSVGDGSRVVTAEEFLAELVRPSREGLLPGRVETCGLWAVVSRGRWRLEHAGRAIAVDTGHADSSFFLPGLSRGPRASRTALYPVELPELRRGCEPSASLECRRPV